MPTTPPTLTPVPFLEAIAWARARKVILPEVYYGELQGLARSMAFSVAGLAKLDQLQGVLDGLTKAMTKGDSFRDWQTRVRTGKVPLDLPPHRLENIYRTNLQGQYGRGRCEQQKRTLEARPWFMLDAVNDSRTRPSHAAMDGKVARYDDPWWKTHTPPNGYQCFLPDSEVSGNLLMGFRYWYEGPAIRFKTRYGRCVTVTANHPILTPDGWIGAQILNDGDKVFRHAEEVESLVLPAKDKNNRPTKAEDVFNTLMAQGRVFGGNVADLDFYGDGVFGKGQVEIVGAKGILRDTVNPKRANGLTRFVFIRANLERITFNALRLLNALGKRLRQALIPPTDNIGLATALPAKGDAVAFSTDGNAVTQKKPFYSAARYLVFLRKLIKRRASGIFGCGQFDRNLVGKTILEDFSIGAGAQDATRSKPVPDSVVIMPALPSDLRARLAGKVLADDVVEIERFDYCGHVYDFESANGLILTDGIITSNCRCRRISLSEAQAQRFQAADAKRLADNPDLARERAQAQPDQGWDYNPCAEPTEGLRRAIERKRQECLETQFAYRRNKSKLRCELQPDRTLDMLLAPLDSNQPMPEPRRLDLPLLPTGQSERYYLERFMREFGEAWNGTAIIDAPTGHSLSVSPLLFTDHKTGKTKIDKEKRSGYVLYLAETILRPDEIRLHQGSHGDRALYLLGRYIVKDSVMNTLAVFKQEEHAWLGWTAYQTFRDAYFEAKRSTTLIYRRE